MPFDFTKAIMTHAEIGLQLGVTRSRIQQIEDSAIRKLRRAMKKRGLDFRPGDVVHAGATVTEPDCDWSE